MTRLAFTVPGKPQPKERARRGRGGRWYTPEKTRRYQHRVSSYAHTATLVHHWHRPGTAYDVTAKVYFPDRRPRDIDNVIKSLLDGINKSRRVWEDDRQVRRVTAERALDREHPRVEVVIEVVEEGSEAA